MILFIPDKIERGSIDSYFVLTDSDYGEWNQVVKGEF
mgnify:CR=1 FL=1